MRELGEELAYDVDDKHLVSEALRDTVVKYFQYVGFGKACTKKFLYSFFSTRWSEYNTAYGSLAKRTKHLSDTILKAQKNLSNIDSLLEKDFQIAAVAFPYERAVGSIVVADTIDLISVNKLRGDNGTTEVNIVVLDTTDTNASSNLFAVRMRALMSLAYARRDLLGSDLNINTKVVNFLSGSHKNVSLSREHRFNYPRLLKSIAKNIEDKNFYPTSVASVCKTCVFRMDCQWRSD
jgi:CRISPR/Cas system-associated exonuclease Cas4 (RecB family)